MDQFPKIKTLLTLVLCSQVFCALEGVQFNRTNFFVQLQPYIYNSTANILKNMVEVVTIEEIKTMLKVVSTKFSTVSSFRSSSHSNYTDNVTYFNTFSEIYIAEAAAILNRESGISAKNIKKLHVYIGIQVHLEDEKRNTELKVALEAARKSNKILPGTAVGFILTHNDIGDNLEIADFALAEALKLKDEAKKLNMKIGFRTSCKYYNHIIKSNESLLQPIENIVKNFLIHFDFMICADRTAESLFLLGINKTFEMMTDRYLDLRDLLRSINPNITFMVGTKTSSFPNRKEHLTYLQDYWTLMDKWGTKNDITIWMEEAFDNPWKAKYFDNPAFAHLGWWRVNDGMSFSDVNAYEEKVTLLRIKSNSSSANNEQENLTDKPQASSSNKFTIHWMYIASGIGPSIAVIALVLFLIYWIRSNNMWGNKLTKEEVKNFRDGHSHRHNTWNNKNESIEMQVKQRPYDKRIEIPKNNFQIFWSEFLGSGQFGIVCKASILETSDKKAENVAFKMTRYDCPKYVVESFLSEIKILLYLGQHDNLVSIKGAYTAEIQKGVVYIALELCEFGSLERFLRNANKRNEKHVQIYQNEPGQMSKVSFGDLVQWAYDIACGMEYLAAKKVIHADLATRNVLVTSNRRAKITDFGLSKRLYQYTKLIKKQQTALPWKWMAIESLRVYMFSTQSDVWSFGVTLWEIFSMGDVPYPGISWTSEFVDDLEAGLRMKKPRLASPEIYLLMTTCWELEPQNRLTFAQLKQSFARMFKDSQKPLDGCTA